ncbi:hypothetical protein Acr_25g0000570 [Actinidia rufa]|uniref:Uncharacterized protein n=1 Tax=Actinidia rufa TaxID=165716 RepID=A0A7J0GY41_9ERIC|nr:hypothetical protein Acr_25g0000570 [Actinidia rufa]
MSQAELTSSGLPIHFLRYTTQIPGSETILSPPRRGGVYEAAFGRLGACTLSPLPDSGVLLQGEAGEELVRIPKQREGVEDEVFLPRGEWEFPSGGRQRYYPCSQILGTPGEFYFVVFILCQWSLTCGFQGRAATNCRLCPRLMQEDGGDPREDRARRLLRGFEGPGFTDLHKHFAVGCTALSTSGGDNTTSGDEGEFVTREDSVEYLGVIRRDIGGAIRRALPAIPDETLLRWLGGKVKGPVYESPIWDVRLQFRFRLCRLEAKPRPRRQRRRQPSLPPKESLSARNVAGRRPFNRNKRADASKGKEAVPSRRLKDSNPTDGAINARGRATEAGLYSRWRHGIRIYVGCFSGSEVVVFASSLASAARSICMTWISIWLADSAELELVKAQNRAVKAENRLAELNEEGSEAGTEVDDLKATVAELKNKLAKAKELAIEDFKASGEFKGSVIDSAATYFSEGFEFCKRQLLYQYPNLGVDVANMAMTQASPRERRGEERRRRSCCDIIIRHRYGRSEYHPTKDWRS